MEEENINKKYPFEGNKWLKKNKFGQLVLLKISSFMVN